MYSFEIFVASTLALCLCVFFIYLKTAYGYKLMTMFLNRSVEFKFAFVVTAWHAFYHIMSKVLSLGYYQYWLLGFILFSFTFAVVMLIDLKRTKKELIIISVSRHPVKL